MKRAALALALASLTACGHGDESKSTAPVKEAGNRDRAMGRALEQVRRSKLPADAKRELEEAAKLLDEQR
jgi:hypothetical protein